MLDVARAELSDTTALQYIAAIVVAIASAVTASLTTLRIHKVRNGTVTKADLLLTEKHIEENARRDRHELGGEVQKLVAAFELKTQRIEANIAEYVKSNERRLRAVERTLDRSGRGEQQDDRG